MEIWVERTLKEVIAANLRETLALLTQVEREVIVCSITGGE
jgi:hypothetical protein